MPNINSYVIYGTNGVCKVTAKRTERLCGTKKEYYVLVPLDSTGAAIYIPSDNVELISRMRKIMTREEILDLLISIKGEYLTWQNDRKERGEQFAAALNSGSRRDLMLMISCIFDKKTELTEKGKHLSTADEAALKRAEKLINDEFSLSLGITPEEVPAFIAASLNS